MLAVDTNVLVYAHRREPPEHATALDMLRSTCCDRWRWARRRGPSRGASVPFRQRGADPRNEASNLRTAQLKNDSARDQA